jgi:hypothetical protein
MHRPYGKDPGEKVPGQKRKIGAAAARAYKERLESRTAPTPAALPQLVTVFQASPSSSDRKLGIAVGLPLLATRLWNRLRRGREQGA